MITLNYYHCNKSRNKKIIKNNYKQNHKNHLGPSKTTLERLELYLAKEPLRNLFVRVQNKLFSFLAIKKKCIPIKVPSSTLNGSSVDPLGKLLKVLSRNLALNPFTTINFSKCLAFLNKSIAPFYFR